MRQPWDTVLLRTECPVPAQYQVRNLPVEIPPRPSHAPFRFRFPPEDLQPREKRGDLETHKKAHDAYVRVSDLMHNDDDDDEDDESNEKKDL